LHKGTNTFQLKFVFLASKLWAYGIVGVKVGVAPCWNKLELRKKLRNLHTKSQLFNFCSFRDLSVHPDGQTDGHGWIDSPSVPFKNTYTLWGRKRFLLHFYSMSNVLFIIPNWVWLVHLDTQSKIYKGLLKTYIL